MPNRHSPVPIWHRSAENRVSSSRRPSSLARDCLQAIDFTHAQVWYAICFSSEWNDFGESSRNDGFPRSGPPTLTTPFQFFKQPLYPANRFLEPNTRFGSLT